MEYQVLQYVTNCILYHKIANHIASATKLVPSAKGVQRVEGVENFSSFDRKISITLILSQRYHAVAVLRRKATSTRRLHIDEAAHNYVIKKATQKTAS
jgi:hypothetical protein